MNESLEKIIQCPNCKRTITEGDKYCRFCGTSTSMSEPNFIESVPRPVMDIRDRFGCIYGPPPAPKPPMPPEPDNFEAVINQEKQQDYKPISKKKKLSNKKTCAWRNFFKPVINKKAKRDDSDE